MKKAIDITTIFKNKLILAISIFIAVILISFGVIYANNIASKGELNDDGEINYLDVSLLEMHLIQLKELPEDKLSNADMNSDGQITVTDLTLLVNKIENRREYTVELINLDTPNYYPKKGEDIEITFGAIINYEDVVLQKIIINEQEYVVQNENGIYKIKVKIKRRYLLQKKKFRYDEIFINIFFKKMKKIYKN